MSCKPTLDDDTMRFNYTDIDPVNRILNLRGVLRIVLKKDFVLVTKVHDITWRVLQPHIESILDTGLDNTSEDAIQIAEITFTKIQTAIGTGKIEFLGLKNKIAYFYINGSICHIQGKILRLLKYYMGELVDNVVLI